MISGVGFARWSSVVPDPCALFLAQTEKQIQAETTQTCECLLPMSCLVIFPGRCVLLWMNVGQKKAKMLLSALCSSAPECKMQFPELFPHLSDFSYITFLFAVLTVIMGLCLEGIVSVHSVKDLLSFSYHLFSVAEKIK